MNEMKKEALAMLEKLGDKPGSVVLVTGIGRHAGEWIKLDPKACIDEWDMKRTWASLDTGEVRHFSWLVDDGCPIELRREGPA